MFPVTVWRVIVVAGSMFASVASPPASCDVHGICDGGTHVPGRILLQTRSNKNDLNSANTEEEIENMRSDDLEEDVIDEEVIDGTYPIVPWPETVSGKVCAMKYVKSMRRIKYTKFGAYDFSSKSQEGLKDCERKRWCIPLLVLKTRRKLGVDDCQKLARGKNHPHFAFGQEGGKTLCYTFADCPASGWKTKSGFKIYSRPPPSTMDAPQGAKISCRGEEVIREELLKHIKAMPLATQETSRHPFNQGWRGQATVLRALWHDVHDFNSLMVRNRETNEWEHVDGGANGYAGVDGCIYESPTAEFEGGHETFKTLSTNNQGTMFNNLQLQRASQNQDFVRIDKLNFAFVRRACFNLCCSDSSLPDSDRQQLCGVDDCALDYYEEKCSVDLMVFAGLLILETKGVPRIPMTWGRKQADCRKPFERVSMPQHLDSSRIAHAGAPLDSFGKPEGVFTEFATLGMNKTEAVALMGAHSFGKIHYYTGGPRTRDRGGGFCTDPRQAKGYFGSNGSSINPITDLTKHLDQWSSPSGECQKGDLTDQGALSCWTNERGYLEPARGLDESMATLAPEWWPRADPDWAVQVGVNPNWGGGGFFDKTPDHFDNEYFKSLNATDPSERLHCCGPTTDNGCQAHGEPMQDKSGNAIDGCDINVNWCLRSNGGYLGSESSSRDPFKDYAALSTKEYVQSKEPNRLQAYHVMRLAADWALIDDADARKTVAEFAQDGNAFKKKFAAAWSKAMGLGYTEGALETCTA